MQTASTPRVCADDCDDAAPLLAHVIVDSAPPAAVKCSGKRRKWSDSELQEHRDGRDISNGAEEERARPNQRARKSTHTVRKEEIQRLQTEAQELESRASALRGQSHVQLGEKALLNALLREARRAQQLSLAVAQSAVSSSLSAEQSNPLHSSIRLGKDWAERRRVLVEMHERKICSAVEYVRARSQLLAPCAPHHSEERFETASGDFCCARFDVIPFEGIADVKQVFDTLVAYSLDLEIRVSEQLGQITVREDYDNVAASILDFRLLSTNSGVQVESHIAAFAKYYESHELSDGAPCAVILMDSVDDDALHPYCPRERVRKDVTQAMVLTTHTRKNRDGSDGDETVVVLRVAKFLKLYHAEFTISPRALQGIRSSMCWTPVMVTTINELLYRDCADSSEV